MEKGVVLRPKYADNMEKFLEGTVATLRGYIESEDWDGFETEFATMVEEANANHELYDKGFLRWKVPAKAPPDLDFTPEG